MQLWTIYVCFGVRMGQDAGCHTSDPGFRAWGRQAWFGKGGSQIILTNYPIVPDAASTTSPESMQEK